MKKVDYLNIRQALLDVTICCFRNRKVPERERLEKMKYIFKNTMAHFNTEKRDVVGAPTNEKLVRITVFVPETILTHNL